MFVLIYVSQTRTSKVMSFGFQRFFKFVFYHIILFNYIINSNSLIIFQNQGK